MLFYQAIYTKDIGRPDSKPLTIFVTTSTSAGDALRWDQGNQVWQYAPGLVIPFTANHENWDRIEPLERTAAEEYARGLDVTGGTRSELPSEEWIEWFFSWKGEPPQDDDPTWEDDAHVRELRARAQRERGEGAGNA